MDAVAISDPAKVEPILARGDELANEGKVEQALEVYLQEASRTEVPPARLCLKAARAYRTLKNYPEMCRWLLAVADAGDDFSCWQPAAAMWRGCPSGERPRARRSARVAILGSYTTIQFSPLLELAAARLGIAVEIYEGGYGQYRQEILDPKSGMYAFDPDFVVLAVHEGELSLQDGSSSPGDDVAGEQARWASLWTSVAERSRARVVQHNFALPGEAPMGHLGARLSGSRYSMTQMLNLRLGEEAGAKVSIVDCERLSSWFGKEGWHDPRYWHLSKQAVALGALPLLARHTAAVIGADLGLSRKCLVMDLDNTLWGGIVGEDGLSGIRLGGGVEGEAYAAFQEYILKLKRKGVVLAVCSKNNEADAREPFEKHPDMRIRLEDIAIFIANWKSKPENIRQIARVLNIGLDSLVFVDDNPVEREIVRRMVPEVDVVALPADPSGYARALSQYLMFETSSFTAEDARRTDQYRALAQVAELESAAGSIEDFYRNLEMKAVVAPFDELHLPRIAQLIGKTNQFNLTTRRHGSGQLRSWMNDPDCVHFFLRLRDRFADHGLVGLMIAHRRGEILDIDTWLMSCRVIGRTVEAEMLKQLCRKALAMKCRTLRGTYIPTAQNEMVRDLFERFGFGPAGSTAEGGEAWIYDLSARGPISNDFIQLVDGEEPRR